MKHLALIGDGPRLMEVAAHLHGAGFAVTLLPKTVLDDTDEPAHGKVSALPPPGLALASTSRPEELVALATAAERRSLPWLFLCDSAPEVAEGQLTTAAYRAGALAVLPVGSAAELVVQAVERSITSLIAKGEDGRRPRRRHYRAGEAIPLGTGQMLRIEGGVVAQVAWHEDGGEGLVGLWGTGQLLAGHPEDACGLTLRAHTDTVVELNRLDGIVRGGDGDVVEGLVARVRRLEAWSSVQSRQNMQDRLLGVLDLLAEQFGEARGDGMLIDVRITHAQLASAIGATRATVTRLLGPLRRRGLVLTVPSAEGERFCLPRRASGGGGGGPRVVGGVTAAGSF